MVPPQEPTRTQSIQINPGLTVSIKRECGIIELDTDVGQPCTELDKEEATTLQLALACWIQSGGFFPWEIGDKG